MWGRRSLAAFLIALSAAALRAGEKDAREELSLSPDDRILVLAPHPDDETLGCGGILQRAVAMKLPVRVVFLTYGDNNEWSFIVYRKHPVLLPGAVRAMGQVRRTEALNAAAVLGVPPEDLVFLGYPDFGTLPIWQSHWGGQPAYRGMLTQAREVPYGNAFRPGAPYKGEEILKDLEDILRDFRPTKVFTSHPADHNPDHRALALFTRVALWDLAPELHASLYPYLIHFRRWASARGYHPDSPLEPPVYFQDKIAWTKDPLTPEMVRTNRKALEAHRSQFKYSAGSLLPLIRANALFGDFPDVPLPAQAAPAPLETDRPAPEERPAELTREEQDDFVGFEEQRVRREGDWIVLSLKLTRRIIRKTSVSVSLFGYRKDTPFEKMPKLTIDLFPNRRQVRDQGRELPGDAVQVVRQEKRFILRVPLALLGRPERVLTGARSVSDRVPLDWTAWRVLDLTQ